MKQKTLPHTTGFATLEIVIALALLVLALSAGTLVTISNQTLLHDTHTAHEAENKAEELLESSVALAQKDFKLVTPVGTTTYTGNHSIYTTSVAVSNYSLFTKKITATVDWNNEYMYPQHISLSQLVTDFKHTTGEDTCDSYSSGDWSIPQTVNPTTSFAQLVGDSSGTYPISDMDVFDETLFVAINNTSANTETFFVFDVHDPTHPTLTAKIDNDVINNTGITGLAIASTSVGAYAYVASASSFTKGQLQVIDIGTPTPHIVSTYKIPASIVSGTSGQGNPLSIFYSNGYVYLGLTKTGSGPEFNIIDVHNPQFPNWVGGFSVGNRVHSIIVRDSFAYLGTANNQELTVLDISDPTHPQAIGGYDAPDSVGSGKSLWLFGDTLYLGRTITNTHPELYILDATRPNTFTPQLLGTREISSSINDLRVRGSFAYILTTGGQFQVWNISSTTYVTQHAPSLALPNSGTGITLDCEGNIFYVASTPNAGAFTNKSSLSVITSSP
jgi:hypothetical protein